MFFGRRNFTHLFDAPEKGNHDFNNEEQGKKKVIKEARLVEKELLLFSKILFALSKKRNVRRRRGRHEKKKGYRSYER